MPNYIFAYHGGKAPETAEEGAAAMAAWQAWFAKLGQAVVEPGNPVGKSKTVSASGVTDDGGSNPLSGYSVVKAPDMDTALGMAKTCPLIEDGSVEVAEIVVM